MHEVGVSLHKRLELKMTWEFLGDDSPQAHTMTLRQVESQGAETHKRLATLALQIQPTPGKWGIIKIDSILQDVPNLARDTNLSVMWKQPHNGMGCKQSLTAASFNSQSLTSGYCIVENGKFSYPNHLGSIGSRAGGQANDNSWEFYYFCTAKWIRLVFTLIISWPQTLKVSRLRNLKGILNFFMKCVEIGERGK